MKRGVVALAVLVVACAGEEMPMDAPADPAVLMEADRAFNDAVAEGGSDAWASWFAQDGAILREGEGEVRGREAVRAAMAGLDDPNVSLTWEPERADVSAGGDLGWTTGPWVSRVTRPDGTEAVAHGRYVSIWKLQDDGSWKVVMDLGNPTEAPESGTPEAETPEPGGG